MGDAEIACKVGFPGTVLVNGRLAVVARPKVVTAIKNMFAAVSFILKRTCFE
jgi:hypothetical protein